MKIDSQEVLVNHFYYFEQREIKKFKQAFFERYLFRSLIGTNIEGLCIKKGSKIKAEIRSRIGILFFFLPLKLRKDLKRWLWTEKNRKEFSTEVENDRRMGEKNQE